MTRRTRKNQEATEMTDALLLNAIPEQTNSDSNKGLVQMIKKFSIKAVVVGIAAVAAIGGGQAYASFGDPVPQVAGIKWKFMDIAIKTFAAIFESHFHQIVIGSGGHFHIREPIKNA
jgi:hypothetical protein